MLQPGGSQPNTPRLEHPSNAVTSSQLTGWSSHPFSSSFSGDTTSAATTSSNKWGVTPASNNNNNSNMQSAWGSQSPNLSKQPQQSLPQHKPSAAASLDWSMPTGSALTTQWGMPSTPVTQAEPDSWGQPNIIPDAGTDGWAQSTTTSSGSSQSQGATNTPSSVSNTQLAQWGQPTSHSSSTPNAWQSTPTNMSSASNQFQPVSSSGPNSSSSSTVQQSQWGATTSAAAPSTNVVSQPTTTSATQEAAAPAPTSWAGAAAKGLPKPVPKPQEPVDPAKVALEQSINTPEGWGRVPVRQDTSWGKPPEKNKQDESNQWHSTQNNGK